MVALGYTPAPSNGGLVAGNKLPRNYSELVNTEVC